MLEVRQASANYGQIQALRGVDVTLEEGRCLAVLGRNGAGKSTLLKLVCGMLLPAEGGVFWQGEDVSRLPPEERLRRGIVLVPEGRGIFPGLSVEENIRMGAYWERPARATVQERWDRVCAFLPKLPSLRRQAAGSLSGGEQQMVAVGRALMSDPKLLLLDEPSLGLAPMVVASLYEVFASLVAESMTIVVVEQFTDYALGLADDVIALNKGVLAASGPVADFASGTALADVYMAAGMSSSNS